MKSFVILVLICIQGHVVTGVFIKQTNQKKKHTSFVVVEDSNSLNTHLLNDGYHQTRAKRQLNQRIPTFLEVIAGHIDAKTDLRVTRKQALGIGTTERLFKNTNDQPLEIKPIGREAGPEEIIRFGQTAGDYTPTTTFSVLGTWNPRRIGQQGTFTVGQRDRDVSTAPIGSASLDEIPVEIGNIGNDHWNTVGKKKQKNNLEQTTKQSSIWRQKNHPQHGAAFSDYPPHFGRNPSEDRTSHNFPNDGIWTPRKVQQDIFNINRTRNSHGYFKDGGVGTWSKIEDRLPGSTNLGQSSPEPDISNEDRFVNYENGIVYRWNSKKNDLIGKMFAGYNRPESNKTPISGINTWTRYTGQQQNPKRLQSNFENYENMKIETPPRKSKHQRTELRGHYIHQRDNPNKYWPRSKFPITDHGVDTWTPPFFEERRPTFFERSRLQTDISNKDHMADQFKDLGNKKVGIISNGNKQQGGRSLIHHSGFRDPGVVQKPKNKQRGNVFLGQTVDRDGILAKKFPIGRSSFQQTLYNSGLPEDGIQLKGGRKILRSNVTPLVLSSKLLRKETKQQEALHNFPDEGNINTRSSLKRAKDIKKIGLKNLRHHSFESEVYQTHPKGGSSYIFFQMR